jgi:Flp pilus assembly protein CpaB
MTSVVRNGLSARARAEAAAFGHLRSVPVVTRDLDAGAEIGPGDVVSRRLPVALLPKGSVATAPRGRVVVVPMTTGEVVLESKVAPTGLKGVAALLPEGTRALAVPVGAGTPPLAVGNHVDLLAAFSPDQAASSSSPSAAPADGAADAGSSSSNDPSFPVAEDAVVVAVGHESVTVAVDQDAAPAVAYAIAAGTVLIALTTS